MKNQRIKGKIENIFILILSLILIFCIGSETYAAGVFSSGFKSASNLTYYCESGSSTSIASKAISIWNGVSSKVKITKYSGSDANIRSSITMSCNKYSSPTSGEYGRSYPYKAYGQNSASAGAFSYTSSQQWVKVICYQYKNSDLDNSERQAATAGHEVGHALSLDHKGSEDLSSSIMKQGLKDTCKLYSYDKKRLKEKWGK